ncbi:ligand-binding sensor domain-containing protein [Chitinophaga ginsengisoli]|uniref:histidine kinase n=1 Tax=Chitinophaga ginsengisoli TaxID=363837 RepID=A0A2P8G0Q6_9BACT|nr:sensor histidine kinase [Chitinophaga ginsengisoli]PSL27549.1 signal transduction histidine kinase [Chitinophaga ginsengisoli]
MCKPRYSEQGQWNATPRLYFQISICLLICLFIGATGPVSGQSYYFRHYQVENGLSNNAVICSLQDSRGFMWFGTKDGLNRFDGYTFKVFRHNPQDSTSIGSNFIHALYEGADGTLWVGTENGLYQYDNSTESFRLLDVAPKGQVRAIQGDSTGNIWFVSGVSLFRYHQASRQLQYFNTNSFFEASSLCLSSDGNIWVATTDGYLQQHHAGTFTAYDMFSHSTRSVSRWIEKIASTRDGRILVGTSNQGAKQFDIVSGTYTDILSYNDDHTEIFVRNFLQTADHEYWIATETGIFIYNTLTGKAKNLRKMYNDPYSISDNAVYTFCRDKEGGIWAGTYFGGVNYYPTQYTPFRKYFPKTGENSLSGNVIREIHADRYNNLWIGTEDAGLNKLDPTTQTFTHFLPGAAGSISYTNIHGLLLDGDDLWIGTFEHGLDVLNIRTGKVTRRFNMQSGLTALQSNFIYCIYHPPGGAIMLGTTRGAYQYDKVRNDFVLFSGLPLVNWYSCLLQDRSGVFWAGTYGSGVHFYDPSTGTKGNFRYAENDTQSLSSDRVNSIFEDSGGHLWFATEGGLCRYNSTQKSFTRYTTQDGFPSNFILSILEDKQANLWISTSRGLSCFNPRNGSVKTYTRANGLLSDQFNFNSAYKDAEGRMYFGSGKGFISFNPAEFVQNTFAGPVYITGFQVNNRELAIAAKGSPLQHSVTSTDKITLSYHQSTFSIDFALLSYTAPEIAEYAYKMENLDKSWTYLKTNRKAYFTELAPGTYIFRVKARNSGGVWPATETTLVIEIMPPWWRSWWALILYAVLAIGIIWYIIRNYHKRIEAKNRRKIELFEAAKEKEVFKAKIEFFTNVAHEIKTPLTLIKAPLEKVIRKAGHLPEIKDSLSIMERNTNRLVGLTTQLLDFRQTELNGYSLSFVKTNIRDLLEEMYTGFKTLAEQKQLELSIELPTELYAYVDIEAFNKILGNLIGNAIKYAATVASIRLLVFPEEENYFIIEVSNDGHLIPEDMKEKIFEPFFRLKETEMQKGTGIGLALSRSLATLHKGSLTLQPGHHHLNVFVLRIPVHQEIEFNLQPGRTKTITTTNQTS